MPDDTAAVIATAPGPVSTWLSQQGFDHEQLPADHLGVEVLGIEPEALPLVVTALKASLAENDAAADTELDKKFPPGE